MPEPTQLVYKYQELVEMMLKAQGIHEGIWGLYVRFGLNAQNIGTSDTDLHPTAVIPVLEIGLQKFEKETNLSLDAARVNPKPQEPEGGNHGQTVRNPLRDA
jgi:hypothetical protein